MKQLITFVIIITIFSNAYSQSPGGVSGAGTNQLWLDANQLGLSNGALVSTWTDKSGKGFNATSTSTYRPTFKTNQFNGLPAVQFDGVDDRIRTGAISALSTNKISSFTVFSSDATTTGVLFRYAYATGGGSSYYSEFIYGQYYNNSTNTLTHIVRNSNTSPPPVTIDKTSYSGALSITSELWNGATALEAYYNGVLVNNVAGSNSNPGGNIGVSIGANYNQTPNYLKCLVAEHISYSKVMSSAERNIIENYLGAKYNIAIGNDMYAYEGTAGVDVVGLGKEADGSNLSARGVSPLGLVIATLNNGEYILAGHNNAGYSANNSDVPLAGYSRFNQVWRSDVTGAPDTLTVTFDVSTYGLGQTGTYKLLVDGDGVFAAGATSYNGVYGAGTVTFTGVTLSAGSYFTLANSNGQVNSTGVTTDWHTTTTWDCGCIPVSGMIVDILPTHVVDINGQNAAVSDLTIDGTLTFSGTDTLTVLQNLTNNNVFTSGAGAVLLNGSIAQTLSDTLALNNLIIDNAAGVTNAGTLSVTGFIKVISGSLTTGNNLTLISTASGTGALSNPSTGTIIGTLTVQRYINETTSPYATGNSWYLLSPMVTDGTLEDWNQEFEMQGFTGTDWVGGISSVYYYDQNNNVTSFNDGYTVPINTLDVLDNTVGYEIWIGDDTKATGARTIDITGTPKLGAVAISAPHIVKIGDPTQDGWTLMANPYDSPVLFGNIQITGAFDFAYRRNAIGNNGLINSSYTLAVGEAFFVHAGVGGATLTFDPTDVRLQNIDRYNERIAEDNNKELLTIKLSVDNKNFDETFIGFNESAIDVREIGVDALKLNTSIHTNPNISTLIDNHDYHSNILNYKTNSIVPIRIYTENPSGTVKQYTIDIEHVKSILEHNKKLVLEDRTLNTFTELLDDAKIDFSMADDSKEPRFFLHISTPINFTAEQVSCTGKENGKATATMNQSGSYSFVWRNEDGTVIKNEKNSSSSVCSGLTPGNYVLEVNNVKQKFTITQPEEVKADFVAFYGGLNYGGQVSTQDEETLVVNAGELITFESQALNQTSNIWDFGDRSTSSLENTTHIYFEEGIYKVELTSINGSCSATNYKTIQVNAATSISETNLLDEVNVLVKENDIFVYMNNQNNSGNVKFEVLNTVGQVVYSSTKAVNNNNHIEKIRIDEAAGLYFLTIEGFNQSKTKKIILK